jgi:hypothetical protein
MSKLRLMMGALAVLFVAAIASSSASAAEIGCEAPKEDGECFWSVEGSKLAESAKEATVANIKKSTQFVLKGKVAGTEVELTATGIKTEGGELLGGNPGTGEATVVMEGVKVAKPKGCELTSGTTLTTEKLGIWIGWLYKVKENKFKLFGFDIVLLPKKEGGPFAKLTLKKSGSEACSLAEITAEVTGDAGAQVNGAEATAQTLNFDHTGEKWLTLLFGHELVNEESFFNPELKLAGEAAQIKGEAEVKLTSGKKFGIGN